MNRTLHSVIQSEYDRKQQLIEDQMNYKKEQAALKIPRLAEIESQIQLAGVRYNKSILLGGASAHTVVGELHAAIEKLQIERQELLAEAGFPPKYLEPEYTCSKCKDTGIIEIAGNLDKCSCYMQKLINLLYSQSNLKQAETENFTAFNPMLYPDWADQSKFGIEISPRTNILDIKDRCLGFIENFYNTEDRNLFFSGPTGVGKTFMSNCIAMELLHRGVTVLYQTAPMLFNVINEYKMRSMKDDDFQDSSYKNIFQVALLIIDDLGTEPWSASRYAEFLNILNLRDANNQVKPCKTIISTNIGIKELYEYYDERVASRIIGSFDVYRFAGRDIRGIKQFT